MSKIHPAHVEFEYKPIAEWTGGRGPEKHNDPFRISNGQVQSDLACELAMIGVKKAMFQVDVADRDIRLDGKLRANASPRSGRVILTFEHPTQGPISMPCWKFRRLWANLRAISLTLNHLRGVDRYGVTQRGEQYSGWKQLPSTSIVVGEFRTLDAAAQHIAQVVGEDDIEEAGLLILEDIRLFKDLFRIAAMNAHPDRQGGSEEVMRKLNIARDMITRHYESEAA